MPLKRALDGGCPRCGERIFYQTASTELQIGEKLKWRCTTEDCDYTFVCIGGDIDSTTT